MSLKTLICIITFSPLLGALISGLFNKKLPKGFVHSLTIALMFVSLVFSLKVFKMFALDGQAPENFNLYTWASGSSFFDYQFSIGFLIDSLTSVMLVVVTFVSFLVHIYSIGYMDGDGGYRRFFAYISLFTFAMLMLVTSNNFLQLFFGWEGVGLVSYLLIGFWYKKESAIEGNLKAFLVNRVGDFGFILGIGLILAYTGALDYQTTFKSVPELTGQTISLFGGHPWQLVSVICFLLFVGAMGKSAQVPLHVWLPESMEGPTPISALIHAATMVTAGVFMVARMSPLFEYTPAILNVVLVIGATGALFTGLIGVVMNDIKRVVAYSTLSQLGYMMVAMGISAYSAGIFHLATHACFKALLFLSAGSVIIAMHHDQDIRNMGGLRKYMPITYVCTLIGSLALCAVPPFAGFYSKDIIIDATQFSNLPGATYAYYCVLIGALVTSLYTFRSFFLVFHGKERMDEHTKAHLKESPWVVTVPLIALAIPSTILGYIMFRPMLFNSPVLLSDSIKVLSSHNVLSHFHGEEVYPFSMMMHAPHTTTFWLAISGIVITWYCYLINPRVPEKLCQWFKLMYAVLINKFGFDAFNQSVLVPCLKGLGQLFYCVGDRLLIDGLVVNGTAKTAGALSRAVKRLQTGYLAHYAIVMILTICLFLAWLAF